MRKNTKLNFIKSNVYGYYSPYWDGQEDILLHNNFQEVWSH